MNDGLEDGKVPSLAVKEVEGGVAPVSDVKQDDVPSGEECKDCQVDKAQYTCTGCDGRDEGLTLACENVVRLQEVVWSHHENEVDEAQIHDKHGLTPGGHQSDLSW